MTLHYNTCSVLPDKLQFEIPGKQRTAPCGAALQNTLYYIVYYTSKFSMASSILPQAPLPAPWHLT